MSIFGKKTSEEKKVNQPKRAESKTAAKKAADKSGGMKDLYKDQAAVAGAKKSEKKAGDAYRILVKPLITEKAANLNAGNKYVFAVSLDANKLQVGAAVREVYGVEVAAVNISRVSGKKVRYGRYFGQRKDWKKAVVTLPKGKTINIYEGV